MSNDSQTSSPLVRFLDSFLQEKNIKWLLGIGTMIVLGSSLRLVATHWTDYPPVWKFLVLIGYTGVVFAAGELSYWRLALRKTGTVLMGLTVLLLPISFLALHWIQPTESESWRDLPNHLGLAALLAGNCVFSFFAARKIFGHFLRGQQPTFLASYLLLSVAGAIVPALPGSWCPAVGLTLWAIFTAGTIKVNRYVFWLVEEHRLPRVCGFFPIGLLAAQFLTIVTFDLARFVPEYLSLQWVGLALVLTAVPVLLSADALAGVFERRTGGLVRPLPWSIVLPLGTALLMIVGGVGLAATGLPCPYAMTPTALIAAALLAVTARRTNQQGLVWASLTAVIAAYNFSPVFFVEFARAVIQHGASAVREDRLPLAFYGLTYLPLLLGMTIGSRLTARRSPLFATPMRQCAICLAGLLSLAACGHSKALFPVGVVMTGVFALQAVLFQKRRLLLPGIGVFLLAALGWTPFAGNVLGLSVSPEMPFLALATASSLLLVASRPLDRWYSQSFGATRQGMGAWIEGALGGPFPCRSASFAATLFTATGLFITLMPWSAWLYRLDSFPTLSSILLCGLLLVHAVVWLAPGLGELAIVGSCAFAGLGAYAHGWSPDAIALAVTWSTLAGWIFSYLLATRPRLRIARAYAGPLKRVSSVALSLLLLADYGPRLVLTSLDAQFFGPLPWLSTLAVVAWCFDAARRSSRSSLTVLGSLGVLGLTSAAVGSCVPDAAQWYPAAWAAVACLTLPATIYGRRRIAQLAAAVDEQPIDLARMYRLEALVRPVQAIALVVLYAAAFGSLLWFIVAARVAAVVALAGLYLLARSEGSALLRRQCQIVAHWQVFGLLTWAYAPGSTWIFDLNVAELLAASLPIALFAAASGVVFECLGRADARNTDLLAAFQRDAMRAATVVGLIVSLGHLPAALGPADAVMAAFSFVGLVVMELQAACRQQREDRVWLAETIVAAGIAYFATFGIIRFGQGWSLFVPLVAGFVAWSASRWAARHPRSQVLAGPLGITGMCLPLGTVVLGVVRHVAFPQVSWLGMNSLALLLAAGFYFWRGLERRNTSLLLTAATITNVALALLWRELAWSDPQLFMIPIGATILLFVEALKAEIPEEFHNPLRYLGALVILVSPTFHIVGGSWLHLLTLMVASVLIVLVAMGLRVRALMYTGTAFLAADLVAMVVRGSIDQPNLLWFAGIVLGASVIAVAAICENHREEVLQRLRLVAANMADWE